LSQLQREGGEGRKPCRWGGGRKNVDGEKDYEQKIAACQGGILPSEKTGVKKYKRPQKEDVANKESRNA